MTGFSHLDHEGTARMVDAGEKVVLCPSEVRLL